MTLKTPSGHDPSIPNFGPIYSFFIRSLSLSLSPSVEDQNLLPLSDLLSNPCFVSLICSQTCALWLTTKLCRPKTLLTLPLSPPPTPIIIPTHKPTIQTAPITVPNHKPITRTHTDHNPKSQTHNLDPCRLQSEITNQQPDPH